MEREVREENSCPVIGILAQTWTKDEINFKCYIAASYVKFIEAAGARVVPILTEESDEYYEKVYNCINGLLLPGGGQSLATSSYAKLATKFMAWSRKTSENGGYFPIWGTCLGFEQMIFSTVYPALEVDSSSEHVINECIGCKGTGTVLHKSDDWDRSYLIQSLPKQMIRKILNGNVCAYNWHKKCIKKSFMKHPSLSEFRCVASSYENDNAGPVEYVAVIENVKLGWYGVQCHPEKAQFEFGRPTQICHTDLAIRFGFETALFFVKEARKNKNEFTDPNMLIYNYNPRFVKMKDWQQLYLFKWKDNILDIDGI